MTTKNIENDRKNRKKWTRWDARGILTPFEKQKLKDGTWKYDRHLKFRVKMKTEKALYEDIPLVLSVLGPEDFMSDYTAYGAKTAIPPTQMFLKSLIIYYYKLIEHSIWDERAKRKLKLKVASREVWKRVNETLKEAKSETKK